MIFEPIIFIVYLMIVILMGSYLLKNSVGDKFHKIFGSLAFSLSLADGIYIIPRMYSVLTTGIEDNLKVVGWGRMGNAIIITIFFLILYDAYNERFKKHNNNALNKTFFVLSLIRIILCVFPGNKWFELTPSSTYAILRFIPLAIMGLLLIIIMYIHSMKFRDTNFKIICISTFFSIFFIEPLIFFPQSPTGVLIITILRTIALTSIVFISYRDLRKVNLLSRY